jgi:glutaredoxin
MMKKMSVILYSMHDCPFCAKAKEVLKDMKVPFEERNVSESIKHRQDLLKRSNDDKLPTVVINDQVLVKPGEDKLRAMINFEKHR